MGLSNLYLTNNHSEKSILRTFKQTISTKNTEITPKMVYSTEINIFKHQWHISEDAFS